MGETLQHFWKNRKCVLNRNLSKSENWTKMVIEWSTSAVLRTLSITQVRKCRRKIETESDNTSSSSEDENGPQINEVVRQEVDEPGGIANERYSFRPRPTREPDRFESSQITFLWRGDVLLCWTCIISIIIICYGLICYGYLCACALTCPILGYCRI